MTATIYDVAKLAGVSTATVSRAFSEPQKLRAATLKKVQEAATALSYSPNAIARAMVTQKSGNVAFIICKKGATTLDSFYARICEGIMSRLSASNRQLQISTAADWEANANGSRNKQVEGVVLGGDASPDMVADFLRRGVSVVFVNNDIGSFDVPSVVADERGGIEQIIDHLTKKGHKRIAMLAGAFSPYVSKARYGGFLEAMEKRGLPVTSDAVQLCAPDDIEGSVEAAMTLLKRPDRPTAIVGANDVIAAGAMKAAMRLGIRIPEELSVVGIDDSNLCPAMEPELTSVRIHCRRMGEESARVLEALLNKEESVPRNTVVPVELIIRRSC